MKVGDLVRMKPNCNPEYFGFGIIMKTVGRSRVKVKWEKLNWQYNGFPSTSINMMENLSETR